jgi:hypothetical protein
VEQQQANETDGVKMADALRRHVECVSTFLRAASEHGVPVIVTLAKPGWVDISSKHFLPGLEEVLNELDVKVVYARSVLPAWKMRSAVLNHMDVLQLMKQAAMHRCIKKFYNSRPDRSWKNIVCIGDSTTEHVALTEAVFTWPQPDGAEPCRCKMVKLPEIPSLVQLTSELDVLRGHLHMLSNHDRDLHVDLSEAGPSLDGLEQALAKEAPGKSPSAAASEDLMSPCDPESGVRPLASWAPRQEAACTCGDGGV